MSLMEVDQSTVDRLDKGNLLSDPNVVTKYREAADIANEVMKQLLPACQIGARILDLCKTADALILDLTSKVFKKGNMERGIAQPTCISVNNIVDNYSPLEDDATVLQAGDVVKIDLGVHIDGYIATLAHTTIMNPTPQNPITGPQADVVCAAYYAAEVALRFIKPGTDSASITTAITEIAKAFNCTPVHTTCSNILKRFILESSGSQIPNSTTPETDVEPFDIAEGDVVAIDVVLSTGSGNTRTPDPRPLVLQRDVNTQYALKLKSSRAALSSAIKHFSVFPFPLRSLIALNSQNRLGVQECAAHGLLKPHLVSVESQGEAVARFRATVLVLPTGALRITATGLPLPYIHSDHSIDGTGYKEVMEGGSVRGVKSKPKLVQAPQGMDMA